MPSRKREAKIAEGDGEEPPAASLPERERTPDSDWITPDAAQWDEYRRYKSFRLPSSDSQYQVGQYVYIYPDQEDKKKKQQAKKKSRAASPTDEANDPDSDPWWIGYITEVKARDERNVFMKVEWLYTTVAQLKEAGVKSPPRIEGHEVFRSPWSDILPVHAVEDHANIVRFDESNPIQKPILDNEVWFRSALVQGAAAHTAKSGKKRKRASLVMNPRTPMPSVTIKPNDQPSCFCKKPYIPLPLEKGPMVFCPSEGCDKWYHITCLELAKKVVMSPTVEQLEALMSNGADLFSRFESKVSGPDEEHAAKALPPTDDEKEIARLSTVAAQSIVRGTIPTGIVGNGQEVALARELLFPEGGPAIGKIATDARSMVWLCPTCDSPI